jgi:DHA1 family bicyclomycin/chloramphenicol resistance-like MFS transporter
VGAVATIGAILVAAPIGLAFDGTPRPVALGVGLCAAGAYGLLRLLRDPAPASA